MLKKNILTLCLMLTTLAASAQKGEMSIGGTVSFSDYLNSMGVGPKLQYNFLERFRGEGNFIFHPENQGVSGWETNANLHYLFYLPHRLNIYPLLGLGFVSRNYSTIKKVFKKYNVDVEETNQTAFGLNAGGGIEFIVSDHFKVNGEFRQRFSNQMKDFTVAAGCAYIF